MTPEPNRRSFLSFAIFGIGAIFSAILGFPVICYFIDPRNRKAPPSTMKLVHGVKLDDLNDNAPVQGVVRDTRVDGWNLYPNDVIGRVWVVKVGARPESDLTPQNVAAFNRDAGKKGRYLKVMTTICPHLGCSVNLNAGGNGFACPCHSATFNLDGARANAQNPAKRGMDELDWEIDTDDPTANRIKVKFQKFEALKEEKLVVGAPPPTV
jgi:menaquinol-cytochrome c reductase iron-sulfur subunit